MDGDVGLGVVGGTDQLGEVVDALTALHVDVHAGDLERDDAAQRGVLGLEDVNGSCGEGGQHDDRLSPTVPDVVVHLRCRGQRIDLYDNRTDLGAGLEGDDVLRHVGRHQGDPVALLHPERDQGIRGLARHHVDHAVGHRDVVDDQVVAVGGCLRAGIEHLLDRQRRIDHRVGNTLVVQLEPWLVPVDSHGSALHGHAMAGVQTIVRTRSAAPQLEGRSGGQLFVSPPPVDMS